MGQLACSSIGLLTLSVAARAGATDWRDSLALTFDDGQGHTMPYRLFLPSGYDDPGKSR